MTVGRREILFADPKETERLIGRVLAGNEILNWAKALVGRCNRLIESDQMCYNMCVSAWNF